MPVSGIRVASPAVPDLSDLIVAEIPRLRRYARALVRDGVRADDLVQDCLVRAWSRQHLWRRGSNLRAWLFTILHNIHANDARHASRQIVGLAHDGTTPDRAVDPDQDGPLLVADIVAALRRLPDDQRDVVVLVGVEQLSYEEAAGVLDVPVGTVMSRLHRGRERLRRLLADAQVMDEVAS